MNGEFYARATKKAAAEETGEIEEIENSPMVRRLPHRRAHTARETLTCGDAAGNFAGRISIRGRALRSTCIIRFRTQSAGYFRIRHNATYLQSSLAASTEHTRTEVERQLLRPTSEQPANQDVISRHSVLSLSVHWAKKRPVFVSCNPQDLRSVSCSTLLEPITEILWYYVLMNHSLRHKLKPIQFPCVLHIVARGLQQRSGNTSRCALRFA